MENKMNSQQIISKMQSIVLKELSDNYLDKLEKDAEIKHLEREINLMCDNTKSAYKRADTSTMFMIIGLIIEFSTIGFIMLYYSINS